MQPFTFNLAAVLILPIGITKCTMAEEQIDMLYEIADAPDTPRSVSEPLARLAGKLIKKMK